VRIGGASAPDIAAVDPAWVEAEESAVAVGVHAVALARRRRRRTPPPSPPAVECAEESRRAAALEWPSACAGAEAANAAVECHAIGAADSMTEQRWSKRPASI
jgi:hypothetical protein